MRVAGSGKSSYWISLSVYVMTVLLFSCSEKEDPAPADAITLVEAVATASRTAAELQFFAQLSGRDIDPGLFLYNVDIYNVTYITTYQGESIHASGLVIIPATTATVPMISFQHGTTVQQSKVPSALSATSEEVISYAALASMGFITVVPDYIGFGESKNVFHPYYVEEPTADAVVDMLKAGGKLAEEKAVSFSKQVFLAGYSQGGYATLAAHKALESDPSSDFEVIASFPAAGGYDIKAMQEYFFGLETYPDPYYLAYVGMSYESHYDESILSIFFNEPYASEIPSLFNGINSSGDINGSLTDVIGDLVTDDMLLNGDTDHRYGILREKFEENSLVDWVPQAHVYFYHGDADITVPLENSVITYEKLIDNGADPEKLHLIILPGETHGSGIVPYVEDLIKKVHTLKP